MKQDKDWIKAMRNALRDAELPPPAGGWERLQRELGGAAPGPEVSGIKPRGSVWRIYRPRIAAAAAAVLILAVAGEFLLRTEQPRLPYRSPRSRKPYGTPLQGRWG